MLCLPWWLVAAVVVLQLGICAGLTLVLWRVHVLARALVLTPPLPTPPPAP